MTWRLEMRRIPKMPVLVALFLWLAMAVPALSGEDLTIGGVGSAMGTMKLIGRAFEKANPGVNVRVLPSLGTSGAIRALSKNAINVGIIARDLKTEEKKLGLIPVWFARTPFVFVAHRGVPITNVTTDEVAGIYGGAFSVWPDGGRVRMVLRPSADTDTLIARKISPALATALDNAAARPGILLALTDQDLVETVETTPGAFGFSSLTIVLSEGPRVKVLSYNGVRPDIQTLGNGSYPLYKPFALILPRGAPAVSLAFARFLRSPIARKIMEDNGNLPIH